MKRLARHLFTLCAAVSLLLCVAVCALWVRSYWVSDGFTVRVGRVAWECGFSRGLISTSDGPQHATEFQRTAFALQRAEEVWLSTTGVSKRGWATPMLTGKPKPP